MPDINVEVPSYTNVEFDLSDVLGDMDVSLTDEQLFEAINECDNPEEVLGHLNDEHINAYLEDRPGTITDETLVTLVKSRDDLVKLGLALSDEKPVEPVELTPKDQLNAVIGLLTGEAVPYFASSFFRVLLANTAIRGVITDALGEHYARVPFENTLAVLIKAETTDEVSHNNTDNGAVVIAAAN